ncbi:MAG: hypothetical protein OHK0031_08290 [Anaerolineales bacterium]
MNLAQTLAIVAGIVVEILLLWETAERQNPKPIKSGLLAPRFNRLQENIVLTFGIFWALIVLADFFQLDFGSKIISALQETTMFVAFSFLFVFGLVHPKLLPRINEQTLLVITLAAIYQLNSVQALTGYQLAALLAPSLAVLAMIFTNRTLSPLLKSLLYFWYLTCLLLLALQNGYAIFSSAAQPEKDVIPYFITGAAGIFLLLHSIFLVRFFLMLSALLLPQNRWLISQAMPQLFDDHQLPHLHFFTILTFFAALIALNHFTGFTSSANLVSLIVLLTAHFMEFPTTASAQI